VAPRKKTADELEERIAQSLRRARIRFRRDGALGGVVGDFVVVMPDGREMMIQAEEDPAEESELVSRAAGWKLASGADRALVVVPQGGHHSAERGVVRASDLVDVLRAEMKREPGGPIARKRPAPPRRVILAAMPFAAEFDDVFFVAMVPAARAVDAVCKRVDREEFEGDIIAKIRRRLRTSLAVVADVSGGNANVLYEVGFAHARKVPTIHICCTPLAELPFDVRNLNTLKYERGQTHNLRPKLARRLKAVVGA
jgi:hypothetical protein